MVNVSNQTITPSRRLDPKMIVQHGIKNVYIKEKIGGKHWKIEKRKRLVKYTYYEVNGSRQYPCNHKISIA
jgi:hypothetical protein